MLLRLWARRHLLARLDRGAILALAKVTVADLTPATNLIEELVESDLAWEERGGSGPVSKSSRVHLSLRAVTDGVGFCFFLRRRVLTQRRKGFGSLSSSLDS